MGETGRKDVKTLIRRRTVLSQARKKEINTDRNIHGRIRWSSKKAQS